MKKPLPTYKNRYDIFLQMHDMPASFPDNLQALIRRNIPLAPCSTFQIGGPADFFAEPQSPEQFIDLIKFAQKNKTPFFILGGGSNTLFHENGFRGLIIHPVFKRITFQSPEDLTRNSEISHREFVMEIDADAGALLSQVIQIALNESLAGLEPLVGLPGTVGGAIRGNAGAEGVEIKDILESAHIYDLKEQKEKKVPARDLKFSYRHSIFKENKNLFILGGTFHLKKVNDIDPLRKKMTDILKKRAITQPKGKSAGCIFKNPILQVSSISEMSPPHSPLASAPPSHSSPPQHISASRLIDECGLKGLREGDIEISNTHGNFFINHGQGTQKDVLKLIKIAQEKVKQEKGYELKTEIVIVPESRI